MSFWLITPSGRDRSNLESTLNRLLDSGLFFFSTEFSLFGSVHHVMVLTNRCLMIIIIMTMGRHYVSKLRPRTGLFFIPHAIYEHREPRWNDIDRVKLQIRPPEFSLNSTNSHLVAKQEEVAKEIMNLVLWSIFVCTSKGFLTCRKILRRGADGFTPPSEERCDADFYRCYKSVALGRV
jgi:hypothetical protein